MNQVTERSYLLDELGDPNAPIMSRLWCLSLANEIRTALHDKQWHGSRLQDMVNVFFDKKAWQVLGYKTWEECCERRFKTSPAEFEKQVKLRDKAGAPEGNQNAVKNNFDNCQNCLEEETKQQQSIGGGGNSKDYTEARLQRDNPTLYERVKRGELSAHAAAIEAGWRKSYPRFSLPAEPEAAARYLAERVDREWFLAMVDEYMKAVSHD